jgi:hypothetical protein
VRTGRISRALLLRDFLGSFRTDAELGKGWCTSLGNGRTRVLDRDLMVHACSETDRTRKQETGEQ